MKESRYSVLVGLLAAGLLAGTAQGAPAIPAGSALPVPLAVAPDRLVQIAPLASPSVPETGIPTSQAHIEAKPLPAGIPLPQARQAQSTAKTATAAMPVIARGAAITPLCTVLDINTEYTLSSTVAGGSYCYGFEITQRSKTQAFLIGQDSSTNFSLTLIRHELDDSLTVIGTTDQPGNADEILLALTQPGLYYWLMTANASDGSAFGFGALVNTNIDANELNDTMALATPVTDHTPAAGSMDSAQDVDYFKFTAQYGQDVIFELGDTYGSSEWTLEYYNGSSWIPLSLNNYYYASGLAAPSTVYVRVAPNPSATVNPAHTYQLLMGSRVSTSGNATVNPGVGNGTIVRINTNPYLTTQTADELDWRIVLYDTTQHPVPNAEADFRWLLNNDTAWHVSSGLTNSSGVASGVVHLGTCTGIYNTDQTSPSGQEWLTFFDAGRWDIIVPLSDDAGVGGANYPFVTLGHICSQTLIH